VKKVSGLICIPDLRSIHALAVQQIKWGPRHQGSAE
jgi:hypothetical protein